jgi:hypothetical protein
MRKFSYYVFHYSNTTKKSEIKYRLVENNEPEKKDYKRYMTKHSILCMPRESTGK